MTVELRFSTSFLNMLIFLRSFMKMPSTVLKLHSRHNFRTLKDHNSVQISG